MQHVLGPQVFHHLRSPVHLEQQIDLEPANTTLRRNKASHKGEQSIVRGENGALVLALGQLNYSFGVRLSSILKSVCVGSRYGHPYIYSP